MAANAKKQKDIRRALSIVRALDFSTHCRINSSEKCRALVTLSLCFLYLLCLLHSGLSSYQSFCFAFSLEYLRYLKRLLRDYFK